MRDQLTNLASYEMTLPALKSRLIDLFGLSPIDNPITAFRKSNQPDWSGVTPRTFTKDGMMVWQWLTTSGEGFYVRECVRGDVCPKSREFFTNPNIPKELHGKGFVHLRGELFYPLLTYPEYEVGYVYPNAYLQDDIDIAGRRDVLRQKSSEGRFISVTEVGKQVVLIQASNQAKLTDLIVSVKLGNRLTSVSATQHRANVMNEINTANGQPGMIRVQNVGELYLPAIYEYYISITDYLNAVDETAINKYITTIL